MAAEKSRGRALGGAEGDEEEAAEEEEEDAEVGEHGGESVRGGCGGCSGRNERVRGTMRKKRTRKKKEAVGACEDRRRANYWHAPPFFEPRTEPRREHRRVYGLTRVVSARNAANERENDEEKRY